MSSVYQALERARRGGTGAPPPGSGAARADRRFAREMQALTSRLQPLFDERPSVVLAITACGRGEGTTTVATELAHHLATDGRRVLFCGVHGRKPGADESDVVEAAPNFSLFDISNLRRESTNVLDKSTFRDRIEQLRGQYDIIIVDCPPILTDGSWSAVLRMVDGIILVVEAEKTRAAVLRSTTKMMGEVGGHVLGIVFNRRRQYIPRFLYRFL
jgi:succinoglycan biosynthesis transport protein ExoP